MNNESLALSWYIASFRSGSDDYICYRIRAKKKKVILSEYNFWNKDIYLARLEAIDKYELLVRQNSKIENPK